MPRWASIYPSGGSVGIRSSEEALPANFKSSDGWKVAQPSDAKLKGDWWTLFK